MKKIYKISREEATRQAALAGITPLPEDSPYYNEGVSFHFLSRSHLPTSSTKPAANGAEKKPSQEQTMREPESGDDSADPAMACIIALEEKRLGRFLNPREMDDLVRRFSLEDINPPIHPSREIFTKQTNKESRG